MHWILANHNGWIGFFRSELIHMGGKLGWASHVEISKFRKYMHALKGTQESR